MKHILSIALTTLMLATTAFAADDEAGFESIFNGKDLTGWDGPEGGWEVRDGAIWCTGAVGNQWLVWRGEEVTDFELRLKFKFVKGNSGVQVRSKEFEPHQVRGYQAEIAPREKMGLWHHSKSPEKYRAELSLAGEKARYAPNGEKTVEHVAPAEEVQAAFKDGEWNDMVIIGKGPLLIQKINGVVLSELTDEDTKYAMRSGVIALQDHGNGTSVGFKDIRLKRLDASEK